MRRRGSSAKLRQSGRFFWRDTERSQRVDRFLHRQADDVAKRSLDFSDDVRAVTLCRVGTGFIERIYFREVIVDLGSAEAMKPDMGNFMEGCRSCAVQLKNDDRRADVVNVSAQSLKNFRGMIQIARLADDLAFQRHERVGGEDHRFRMQTRDGLGFAPRIEQSQFAQRKIDIELLRNIGRNSLEAKSRAREKFASARRM